MSQAHRPLSEHIQSFLLRASRIIPVLAIAALCLALAVALLEGQPEPSVGPYERSLRIALFILSCFVGSYEPVPGQHPDTPTALTSLAMCLALATSLGGVTLAVLQVFTREIAVTATLLRRNLVIVFGDTDDAHAIAGRLRADGRAVIEIGKSSKSNIRLTDWGKILLDPRVKRALKRATESYVMDPSSVENALIAESISRPGMRTFQMFNWQSDRLVFRQPLIQGKLPERELFSPDELVGIHIVQLVSQIARISNDRIQVYVEGKATALSVARERLKFMEGVLQFRAGVEFVDSVEQADVCIIDLDQHHQITRIDEITSGDRLAVILAPERTFAAIGREDLGSKSSQDWFREYSSTGDHLWRGRVLVVDDHQVGYDVNEISLGLLNRWAREFHNAHSDFSGPGLTNRWLMDQPHPRLVRMGHAAVTLMLSKLRENGFGLVAREGDHDLLPPEVVESCARAIHDQYLWLEWQDEYGISRGCADFYVNAAGELQPTSRPPEWENDEENNRRRNRKMVETVYPAFAAVFGYRITRLRTDEARSQ